MNNNKTPKKLLLSNGRRLTAVREEMFELILNSAAPISAPDLVKKLKVKFSTINKTTVYRQIDFLLERGLVEELMFNDGVRRYEIDEGKEHHHHLICRTCQNIEDIVLKNDLKGEEKEIKQTHGFAVEKHTLEFFGVCKKCKK